MLIPSATPHPTASDITVCATDLVKSYGVGASAIYALRGVNLSIRRGERVAIVGKSGSGKSTLLNLLGGLDRPTSGTLAVGGHALCGLSDRELTLYRCGTVGMIFQGFNLVASRSALENVELPMIFAGLPRSQRRAEAERAIDAVGLGDRLHHRPAELSGGESQRVAIARALVNRPEIILADEPTGNLDSTTAREAIAIVMDYVRRHGRTLVLVTHDEELASSCTDRVLRMADGQLSA